MYTGIRILLPVLFPIDPTNAPGVPKTRAAAKDSKDVFRSIDDEKFCNIQSFVILSSSPACRRVPEESELFTRRTESNGL
jgi:hypothetical protein